MYIASSFILKDSFWFVINISVKMETLKKHQIKTYYCVNVTPNCCKNVYIDDKSADVCAVV